VTPSPLLLLGGTVLDTRRRTINRADVLLVDGRVDAIGPHLTSPTGADTYDARDLLIAPGLVDAQVNGAVGVDLTLQPERIAEVAAALPRHGVTSFVPTVISSPSGTVDRLLDASAPARLGALNWPTGAARILGVHAEGPFLAMSRLGAHPSVHLREPDTQLITGWSRQIGVLAVTLAPELPGASELIVELTGRNIGVWLGHTQASYDQVRAAIAAGARAATHLHNAMPGMSHREPGLVGAVLGDGDLIAGVIVDGHHVHPATVRATWRALGCERFMLISDTTAALDLPDGPTNLGGQAVILTNGVVRLAEHPATLAGSAVGLEQCVRNLVKMTRCPIEEALVAASLTPATLLGIDDIGHLDIGARADVTLWNRGDAGPELVGVVCDGRPVQGGPAWKS
jgi:N-acetylglucosamine-6-phosphate deacetylase